MTCPVLCILVKMWQVREGDQVSSWISSCGESFIHVISHRLFAGSALMSFY